MTDVIDRRRGRVVGAVVAALACALGAVGIRYRCTDAEHDLVDVVTATAARAQDFYARQVTGYQRTQVVLYRGATATACGRGVADVGPFYCAADARVYLDLAFLASIQGREARAYVVAHELAHHVERIEGRSTTGVAAELEADCLAGAWLESEGVALTSADVAAVLTEAARAGDDAAGVAREDWTHGTGAERVDAIRRGLVGGAAICAR